MKITEKLTGLKPSYKWTGKWIWSSDKGKEKNTYYYFRKEFNLKKLPDKIKLYITADSRYRLFINGKMIGQGSIQSQSHYKYYDIREIKSHLQQGKNCIAVVVNYVGNVPYTMGGFLAELITGQGTVIVATDDKWKVKRAEAWAQETQFFRMAQYNPYQEFYDARKSPAGWTVPEFNDKKWLDAEIVSGPWTYLLPRDIPFMREEPCFPYEIYKTGETIDIKNRMRSNDLSIKLSMNGKKLEYSHLQGENNLLGSEGETVIKNSTKHLERNFDGIYAPYIIIDFGKIITAYLEIEIEGVKGGIIDIGYVERLFDGEFNNSIECMFADRYIMKDGKQTYRSFTWRAFRYLKIQLHNCFEEVTIKTLKGVISTYPYEEKGYFKSDNKKYNQLFDICRYTVSLCSNEFIVDTPWREQGQFLGDVSAVTLGLIYSCFGDTVLPAKFLRQCGAMQYFNGLIPNVTNTIWDWNQMHLDYNFWWINGIWEHYMYTGEEKWIHHYYAHIVKIINTAVLYVDDYGLLNEIPYSIRIDWVDIDKRGECTALNAIFYKTLGVVEKMAKMKGDRYTGKLIKKLKNKLKKNFVERLYNKEKGCFVDANIRGSLSEKISEHSNCAPILWDLCDSEMADNIIKKFYQEKSIKYTEAQPFFSSIILKALEKRGYFRLALETIDNKWVNRMVDRGATSTFEEWTINGSWRKGDNFTTVLRSQSHAWSAYPAEFFLRRLIGFEIIEAGCKKIKLNPQITDFNYSIKLPVPSGLIEVEMNGVDVKISIPPQVDII